MKVLTPEYQQRQLLIHRLLEIGLGVCLLIGAWFAWGRLQQLQQSVRAQQTAYQQAPEEKIRQVEIKAEFDKRQHDLERIKSLLIERESITEFIDTIEAQARQADVEVRIPDIKEDIKYDAERNPVPATGPVLDIRLSMQAQGHPLQLLQFLHAVEHLPYALTIASFDLKSLSSPTVSYFSAPVPEEPNPSPDAAPAEAVGELDATIILTVTNTDETPNE